MTTAQKLTYAREQGVSPSALHVLLLAIDDSPITPSRLAEAAKASTAAITGMCDRLERDGWIHRNHNPHDRRSWLIVPTERAFETFSPML